MINLTPKNTITHSKSIVMRKKFLQITGIFLVVLIAALIGNYVAMFATRQIANELTRFVVAIVIAFLVGLGAGFLIKKLWDRLKERYMSRA